MLVKKHFTSRFPNGMLVEADYNALEMRVLAQLTQEPSLVDAFKKDLDVHRRTASEIFDTPYDSIVDDQRKIAKTINFGLIYGMGITKLALSLDISTEEAKEYKELYFRRLPLVQSWAERQIQKVESQLNVAEGRSIFRSITGRKYVFLLKEAYDWQKDRGIEVALRTTEMTNYPIQGLAEGDIVNMMLGKLNRMLQDRYLKECLLANSVHDSVLLDVSSEAAAVAVAKDVKGLLESAPKQIKKVFGIDWQVPLKVDVKIKSSWG